MDRTSLDRYFWEAQAHANELLDLYEEEYREANLPRLEAFWLDIVAATEHDPKKALAFLSQGPTPRERALGKLDRTQAFLLWCQARYLALEAANALQIASSFETMTDRKYRLVVRHAAQVALQARGQAILSALEILDLKRL